MISRMSHVHPPGCIVSAKPAARYPGQEAALVVVNAPADNVGDGAGAEEAPDRRLEHCAARRIPALAGDDVHQLPWPLALGAPEILLEPSARFGGREPVEVERIIHSAFEWIEGIMAESRRASAPHHWTVNPMFIPCKSWVTLSVAARTRQVTL
jgi:hypothetical protein